MEKEQTKQKLDEYKEFLNVLDTVFLHDSMPLRSKKDYDDFISNAKKNHILSKGGSK